MPRTVNVEGTQNARLRKAMLLHMSVGRSEIHPQRSHQILRLSPMGIVLLCARHSSQRLLKLSRCDPTFKVPSRKWWPTYPLQDRGGLWRGRLLQVRRFLPEPFAAGWWQRISNCSAAYIKVEGPALEIKKPMLLPLALRKRTYFFNWDPLRLRLDQCSRCSHQRKAGPGMPGRDARCKEATPTYLEGPSHWYKTAQFCKLHP